MRDRFPGYYLPTDSEFTRLWKDGEIVIDTNVLLNLYKYPAAARDDMLSVMTAIKSRLWLPHQIALEFHRRREYVLERQLETFEEVRNILDYDRIRGGLEALQLSKFHSLISVDGVLARLKPILEDFDRELDELQNRHQRPTGPDPLRDRLNDLIGDRVGPAFTQTELSQIYKEGEERYKGRIPPGYADEKTKAKQPDFTHNGATYRPLYGDLILWKQILRHVKEDGVKVLMFVSDDEKSDWRQEVGEKEDRILMPRPELVEEIKGAGAEVCYIYSAEQFLKFATQQLGVKVEAASISQVKDVKEANQPQAIRIDFDKAVYWDPDRGAVKLVALVDGRKVPCLVSEEALADWFGSDGTKRGSIDAYVAHMSTIQAKAIELIQIGRFEDGQILIRSSDFHRPVIVEKMITPGQLRCTVPRCECDFVVPAYILGHGRLSAAITGACPNCGHDVDLHEIQPVP